MLYTQLHPRVVDISPAIKNSSLPHTDILLHRQPSLRTVLILTTDSKEEAADLGRMLKLSLQSDQTNKCTNHWGNYARKSEALVFAN